MSQPDFAPHTPTPSSPAAAGAGIEYQATKPLRHRAKARWRERSDWVTGWRGGRGLEISDFWRQCRLALPNNGKFLSISGQNYKTIGLVVIDDQHPKAVQVQVCAAGPSRYWPGIDPKGNGDPEYRTAAGFALDLDLPAHHLAQAPHNREAEPGAAEAARDRCVGLGEAGENRAELAGGDSDAGVRD